jgi:hypothetical protein
VTATKSRYQDAQLSPDAIKTLKTIKFEEKDFLSLNPESDQFSQLTALLDSKNIFLDVNTTQELCDYFAGQPGKSYGPM